MNRHQILLSALLGTILSPFSATAEEVQKAVAVPVVVVEAERPVGQVVLNSICIGLSAPNRRGRALQGDLGLVTPTPSGLADKLGKTYNKAQDDFFSGKHDEADRGFTEIIRAGDTHPDTLLPPSNLREIVFKAHLYRAILAHAENKDDEVKAHLVTAAKRFPDLAPRSVDFPPWVRKQFMSLKPPAQTGFGAIVFDAPSGCELDFQGRMVAAGQTIEDVKTGNYTLKAACADQTSIPQRVRVSDGKVVFKPVLLSSGNLRADTSDLVLEIDGEFDRDTMIRDLLSIAESAGWPRLVGVVGHAAHIEVLIADTEKKAVVRSVAKLPKNPKEIIGVVEDLVFGNADPAEVSVEKIDPWYRDGLAWTLLGAGIGVFAAGSVMAWKYGSPSPEESVAWSMLITGAGAVGTGVTLFFIPPLSSGGKEFAKTTATYGIVGRISF